MAELIEAVALPKHGMQVGFVFIQGSGLRVGTRTDHDGRTKHLSIAAARRLAASLEDTSAAGELQEVIEALRDRADRLEGFMEGDLGKLPNVLRNLPEAGHA